MDEFEPHVRPNQSRLQDHVEEIAKMRALNWPYYKIASWLGEHRKCSIQKEAVRQFCLRRGISKGEKVVIAVGSKKRKISKPKERKEVPSEFDFDESRPIQRKR